MCSPTNENLSYLCLEATYLLVPETFKLRNCEMWLPATYNSGLVVKYQPFQLPLLKLILAFLAAFIETHLQNAPVNEVVNKEIVKTCLTMDMVRKNWSWIVVAGCGLHYFVWLLFVPFESLQTQPKDLNIYFSRQ